MSPKPHRIGTAMEVHRSRSELVGPEPSRRPGITTVSPFDTVYSMEHRSSARGPKPTRVPDSGPEFRDPMPIADPYVDTGPRPRREQRQCLVRWLRDPRCNHWSRSTFVSARSARFSESELFSRYYNISTARQIAGAGEGSRQ